MGNFLTILMEILIFGGSKSLKHFAAKIGMVGLPLIGIGLYYAAGGDYSVSGLLVVLAGICFIGGGGLVILQLIWWIQDLRADDQTAGDPYAYIAYLRSTGQLTAKSPLAMADWAGVTLQGADLHNANLHMIGLEGANLRHANLSCSDLRSARLEGASLYECNLSKAILAYARLANADLRNARLFHADLMAADLSHALLRGACIDGAQFDEHTILPDGRKWTPDTDWTQFGVEPLKRPHR